MPIANDPDYTDTEEAPAAEPSGMDEKEEAQSETTTLIPKSMCPGMSVGDEVVLKITAEHDDQFEAKYVPKEKGGGMRDEDPEMASLMEE